jgi:hypothetical protein
MSWNVELCEGDLMRGNEIMIKNAEMSVCYREDIAKHELVLRASK